MVLNFTKMHGLGNDFMVIDAINQSFLPDASLIRQLSDRHLGIGFDQLLLVERPQDQNTEFYYRIFNGDGSEVEQCGNGARCFARFVKDQGLTQNRIIRVGTASGIIQLEIQPDGQVTVNMGTPVLIPAQIPFDTGQQAISYTLQMADSSIEIGAISIGNPHAVLIVDDIKLAPVATLGPQLERHPAFPNHVNAGFMQILARDHIAIRVYERGAGETLACGSGACAAVVYGVLRGLLNEQVKVQLSGGELMVSWAGETQPVYMAGPAATVFDGNVLL